MVADSTARTLPDETKWHWLRLIRSGNVGPQTFVRLINRYGGAEHALDALPGLVARSGGSRPPKIASADAIDAEIEAGHALCARLVARGDPDYPAL
ncbi:MAG: DNA-protecting protein DprA, partial [Pseudomonadota bacterium]